MRSSVEGLVSVEYEHGAEEEERRAMSPVNEAVGSRAPRTLNDVLQILLPRIQPQKGVSGLTVEDQQAFVDIIVGEVSGYWQDLDRQIDNPLLTQSENREFRRRVAVEFLSLAVDLFNSYLTRPAALLKRQVYNSTANATRLKAQLAVEANRRLNVTSIRRRVFASLRSDTADWKPTSRTGSTGYTAEQVASDDNERKRAVAREIRDLTLSMPTITSRAESILRQQADILAAVKAEVESRRLQQQSDEEQWMRIQEEETKEEIRPAAKLVKSKSYPELVTLKQKSHPVDVHKEAHHSIDYLNVMFGSAVGSLHASHSTSQSHNQGHGNQKTPTDTEHSAGTLGNEDLPPLLQALGQCYPFMQRKKKREAARLARKQSEPPATQEQPEDQQFPAQPAVISTQLPSMYNTVDVVRSSDIRVSERMPKTCLILQTREPVYNELLGDISQEEAKWMDRNLYLGEEIRDVYQEIMQTVEDEHLLYEKDDVVAACADGVINVDEALSSATLCHRRSHRIINRDLHRALHPPWGSSDQQEWVMSNQYSGPIPLEITKAQSLSGPLPTEELRASRQYGYWRTWWKATIDTEDFLKFVSRTESDYLHHIFHLYDSEGNDSEDEELEKQKQAAEEKRQMKARKRRQKLEELRIKKQAYTDGLWNVNTISMGGLGEDPELKGGGSCHSDSEEEEEEVEPKTDRLSHQERLEAVWELLKMPDKQRLDMAIKYSTIDKRSLLDHVLDLWEAAAQAVLKREAIISELEAFERQASDPGRFFDKGSLGKSTCRLNEAKARGEIYRRLQPVEATTLAAVSLVQTELGDIVTYQGRPYMEKMRLDKTEMLYWLQQERRKALMEPRTLPPLVASKTDV